MTIDWLKTLRDILMVIVLGTLGAILLGLLGDVYKLLGAVIGLAVGFGLSGHFTPEARFRHLLLVALGVWLLRLGLGLLTGSARFEGMLVVGVVVIPVAMLLGGLASLWLDRRSGGSTPQV